MTRLPVEPFKSVQDAQHFLEQRAYDDFRQASEWPRARDYDLDYHELLDPLGGLEVVCRKIGGDRIWCGSPISEHDRVRLSLPAVASCKGSEDDVANFLAASRLAADRYHAMRGKDADLKVADLVENLKIDEPAAKRVIALLLNGSGISGGGGGDRVSLSHLASRMRGVATLDDYLARIAADSDRRLAVAQAAAGLVRRATAPAKRIFLSHAADDAALAHYLADVIRRGSQAKVFVASKAGDIPTGSDWLGAIEEELRKADTYLLLLTPYSVKRFWLWYESGAAWMSDRPFVPVTAAGLAKSDVPYPLGARQALALDEPAGVAQLAQDLGATITDVDRFCETVKGLCESLPWRATQPGTELQTRSAEVPEIDLELALPKKRQRLGRDATVTVTRYRLPPRPRPDAQVVRRQLVGALPHPFGGDHRTDEEREWDKLSSIARRAALVGLGMWVVNPGSVTAHDVQVVLELEQVQGLRIIEEHELEPRGYGGLLTRIPTRWDFNVERTDGRLRLSVEVGKLQPKTETFTSSVVYLELERDLKLPLRARIYADNLPDPVDVPLVLHVTTEERTLNMEQYQAALRDLESNDAD